MCQKQGFQCRVVDNIDYPKAAETLRNLASQGMNLVIANSAGYGDAVLEVASQFPKVWFVMTSDLESTKDNKNVAVFTQDWQQFGFLGGVTAGYLSKTGVMGYVNGQPLLAARRAMSGFLQGARYVNPNAKLLVRYTDSFVDTAKAKEATLAEVAASADVVTGICGGGNPGILQAAQEKRAWYIGYLADEYKSGPGSVPTSMVEDIPAIYQQVGQLYTSKKLEPKLYVGTVANGIVKLAPFHDVPPEVVQKVEAVISKVRSGEISVQQTLYPE
jgi:basic membrane protein A